MEARLDFMKAAPEAIQAMVKLGTYVRDSTGLEPIILSLVAMRTSQINGCAYCLDMHSKDARAEGETEQRLYALNAWSETPFFTDRERAALEWTEALTLVASTHVPDEIYERVRKHFSAAELVNLTVAIATTNGFNRLCISFRAVAGTYQPAKSHMKAASARRDRGKE